MVLRLPPRGSSGAAAATSRVAALNRSSGWAMHQGQFPSNSGLRRSDAIVFPHFPQARAFPMPLRCVNPWERMKESEKTPGFLLHVGFGLDGLPQLLQDQLPQPPRAGQRMIHLAGRTPRPWGHFADENEPLGVSKISTIFRDSPPNRPSRATLTVSDERTAGDARQSSDRHGRW